MKTFLNILLVSALAISANAKEIKLLNVSDDPTRKLCQDYNAAGPLANLELERLDNGGQFATQLSEEEFQQLQLKAGEQVFAELKNVKIFSDDYSI